MYVPHFKYVDNKFVILNTRIDNITLQPLTLMNSANAKFQISSIIVRLGDTINNGHFKIWAHNLQTNKWLLINDSTVRVYKELYKSMDNVNSFTLSINVNVHSLKKFKLLKFKKLKIKLVPVFKQGQVSFGFWDM